MISFNNCDGQKCPAELSRRSLFPNKVKQAKGDQGCNPLPGSFVKFYSKLFSLPPYQQSIASQQWVWLQDKSSSVQINRGEHFLCRALKPMQVLEDKALKTFLPYWLTGVKVASRTHWVLMLIVAGKQPWIFERESVKGIWRHCETLSFYSFVTFSTL